MDEQWRDVVGWPDYQVSSHGRVRSKERVVQRSNGAGPKPVRERILRVSSGAKTEHLHVNLYNRTGRKFTRSVHQLVLEAFVGPRPPGQVTRHWPDRDPTNNRLDNLSYGTQKQNIGDAVEHGTITKKLTCKRGHKLSDAYSYGKGSRNCRKCTSIRQAAYKARKKAAHR